MEGREKKNYTEVLEENDRRNVFNLKCYTEKKSLLQDTAAGTTVLFCTSR